MLHFRKQELPERAEEFLKYLALSRSKNTVSLYRASLCHFHRFLIQSKMKIIDLQRLHIEEFDTDLTLHGLKFSTRQGHQKSLGGYLRWLEKEGDLPSGFYKKIDPHFREDCIKPLQAELPEIAESFLSVIKASSAPNTASGYKSSLRSFYRLHLNTKKRPYNIDRSDIESFMKYLQDRGMKDNQRFARLVQLRRYLDWLFQHKKLKDHPNELIKPEDFPKRVQTLPRPFPPEIDIELQKRLSNSSDIDHLGLYLMRRCGMRVGEMLYLKMNCLETDNFENSYLRIFMPKFKTERLMPLDADTLAVVHKILNLKNYVNKNDFEKHHLISNPTGRKRSAVHISAVLRNIMKDLTVPGPVVTHRLRHTFATSLLSAGINIATLKKLLGHTDIRMTLGYAAVTNETVRYEYFEALTKIREKYETASFPLKPTDLRSGVINSFNDVQKTIKKYVREHGDPNPAVLKRLLYRLNTLRHEFSVLLKLED